MKNKHKNITTRRNDIKYTCYWWLLQTSM